MENCKDVCDARIGIDRQLGIFCDVFSSNDGASVDKGSCNYPSRGGKNKFHESWQGVLAIAGADIKRYIDKQRVYLID